MCEVYICKRVKKGDTEAIIFKPHHLHMEAHTLKTTLSVYGGLQKATHNVEYWGALTDVKKLCAYGFKDNIQIVYAGTQTKHSVCRSTKRDETWSYVQKHKDRQHMV